MGTGHSATAATAAVASAIIVAIAAVVAASATFLVTNPALVVRRHRIDCQHSFKLDQVVMREALQQRKLHGQVRQVKVSGRQALKLDGAERAPPQARVHYSKGALAQRRQAPGHHQRWPRGARWWRC